MDDTQDSAGWNGSRTFARAGMADAPVILERRTDVPTCRAAKSTEEGSTGGRCSEDSIADTVRRAGRSDCGVRLGKRQLAWFGA